MPRLLITGASGRMGKQLIQSIGLMEDCQVVGATDHPDGPTIGEDAGEQAGVKHLDVPVTCDIAKALRETDAEIVIDFTRPEATMAVVAACQTAKRALVTGTTGFDERQNNTLLEAAKNIPIVHSPNFSEGLNLLYFLLKQAFTFSKQNFDVEILELHHNQKVDAPSGTALRLGQVIVQALKSDPESDLKKSAVFDRNGKREPGSIGFASLRAGDSIGEHTVILGAPGERIEITHKASSRAAFALGAIKAASWVHQRQPGLYGMEDVMS